MAYRKMSAVSGLLTSLLAIAAVLSGLTYLILNETVDHWVRATAQSEAEVWAEALIEQVPDLEPIADGKLPDTQNLMAIHTIREVGGVFLFKFYDRQGRLRLVSDQLGDYVFANAHTDNQTANAQKALETNAVFSEILEGATPGLPRLYAEIYMPIRNKGNVIGVAEVLVDQTARAEHFREDVTRAVVMLSALFMVSFSVPYVGFVFRSREKRSAEQKADYLARHDAVTNLLNRAAFMARLDGDLSLETGHTRYLVLHHIDIDHFTDINERLGHHIGDEIIREVADRIRECVGLEDYVGRIGGDEFAVVQVQAASQGDAEELAERLLTALTRPYTFDQTECQLSVSIGCSQSSTCKTGSAELIKKVNLALTYSKQTGRNKFAFFRDTMEQELNARKSMENLIRAAAREQNFFLQYQPSIDVETKQIAGFEALLRLTDENGNLISPTKFIPLAEELGLINEIGTWVLREAIAAAKNWGGDYKIAVNLSPVQFNSSELPQTVEEILRETGFEPSRLELEITENLLLQDSEEVIQQLHALKSLGVHIAMDDFGTGYSSLSYLWRFPFDKIKIDRSFMSDFTPGSGKIGRVIETIISLGRTLGFTITVEGVETEFQATALSGLGCEYIQGYYYSRPVDLERVPALLLQDFLAPQPEAMSTGTQESGIRQQTCH